MLEAMNERTRAKPRRGKQKQNEAPFAEGEARTDMAGFYCQKNPSASEEA